MATFVDLPNGRDARLFLNLDHVVSIAPMGTSCAVTVLNGKPVYVAATYEQTTAAIEAALEAKRLSFDVLAPGVAPTAELN